LVVDVSFLLLWWWSVEVALTLVVSGLSAAHTIYLAGGNVVVLDKQGAY
jgi:hypothetical protein